MMGKCGAHQGHLGRRSVIYGSGIAIIDNVGAAAC
jgi:hypothetical protein